MSEQQEGASGSDIYPLLKDAFDGIPIEGERKFFMPGATFHKLRQVEVESLLVQVEKLKDRRDRWRERYEQARADLEEHKQGREVLAELLGRNPVALLLERERDEARADLKRERKIRRSLEALYLFTIGAGVTCAIARAVLA